MLFVIFFERKVQFCLGEEFSNNSISLWPEHNNTLRHHHHVYDLAARREFLLWGFCYGRPLNSVLYLFPHKTTQRLEKVLDKLKQGGRNVLLLFLTLFDLMWQSVEIRGNQRLEKWDMELEMFFLLTVNRKGVPVFSFFVSKFQYTKAL